MIQAQARKLLVRFAYKHGYQHREDELFSFSTAGTLPAEPADSPAEARSPLPSFSNNCKRAQRQVGHHPHVRSSHQRGECLEGKPEMERAASSRAAFGPETPTV
jgi:hypothetical protein